MELQTYSLSKFGLLFVMILVELSSCQKTLNPKSPEENYSEAAKISTDLSYINVPISLSIAQLSTDLNEYFPRELYLDESFKEDDLKLSIKKAGKLTIKHLHGDTFLFEAPVAVKAIKQVSVLGFTEEASTEFRMSIAFESRVFPTSEWKINTLSKAAGFTFLSEPRLSMAGFNIPAKGIIGGVIDNYQGLIARKIDEKIKNELNLEPTVLKLWNSLKETRKVNDIYDLWLRVDPQDMLLGPMTVSEDKDLLELNVIMKAYIQSYVGAPGVSLSPSSSSLPPLKFVKNAPEGFKIGIDNLISYQQAEEIAKSKLIGEELTFENGKYTVKVENLRLFGTKDNELSIQTKLSGSINGTVYLVGKPVYDVKNTLVKFDNLRFHLKTKNLLTKSAVWLLQGRLQSDMAEALQFPVNTFLKPIEKAVRQNYSKVRFGTIEGKVNLDKIIPHKISILPEGLKSNFTVLGTVEIEVNSNI